MNECEKMMNKILSGERCPRLQEHLAQCADCRSLAELSGVLETVSPVKGSSVPSSLDHAVLAYAAEKQKEYGKKRASGPIRFFRKWALPLAAAAAFCVSLPFVLEQNGKQTAPGRETAGIKRSAVTTTLSYLEADQLNTELLMISSSIEDSSEHLNSAAALSAAFDTYL